MLAGLAMRAIRKAIDMRRGTAVLALSCALWPALAAADSPPPPGFIEPIVHWGVQKGETCEDIAKVMYGSVQHVPLVTRYNRVSCAGRKPLPEGITLILPKTVTSVPDARVKSSHPDVRGRPSGGSWDTIATGSELYRNHNVQTMDDGRAHIVFLDHTHVFLAANTLVVIHGTAAKTSVSKTPPTIEIQAGEVQAGLSALRGDPAEVAVPGGGIVTATSRDTVVELKKARTTVAVFEGKANVKSGGKDVLVPTNFGTRFEGKAPPAPPRPLPPAPLWEDGGTPGVVLAPAGQAVLATSWKSVDKAKAYRLEVSRDEAFHDLVVREEVPATVLAFRAEKMPPGTYRVRVRAIDLEEYLGIASAVRVFEVVAAELRGDGAAFQGRTVTANPYGRLELREARTLDVAIDGGPFGPPPNEIDFLKQAPKTIRFRTKSGTVEEIAVAYLPVDATPRATFDEATRAIRVQVAANGFSGIDVAERVSPSLRVRMGDSVQTAPLAVQPDGSLVASIPAGDVGGEARIDVLDGRGKVLGTGTLAVPDKPKPPPRRGPTSRLLGVVATPFRPSGATAVPWSSPTAPSAALVGVSGGVTAGGPVLQGSARVSGSLGALGLDALVVTTPLEDEARAEETLDERPRTENVAWLGARYRLLRRGVSELEVAPILRLGLPLASQQGFRLDLGAAVGGARGRMTWLGNAGARFRLVDNDAGLPTVHPYVLMGGSYDVLAWMRAYAVAEAHVLVSVGVGDARAVVVPFGLTAGVEMGGPVFVSLAGWVGRAESVTWQATGGGTLSVGLRLGRDGR